MSMRIEAEKVSEFYAHADTIRCVSIGKHTGKSFITGGDDSEVKTWKFGEPTPYQTYDFGKPVTAVLLDAVSQERYIFAGNLGGQLRVQDVYRNKPVRTYNGHRAEVTALDVHPYGQVLASGSTDMNVRLWDVRQKGCICSYKGHTSQITVLRHSPDAQWLVSGDSKGICKLWDLAAGKPIREFHESNQYPITDIAFHPSDMLLATGSKGKIVRFWNLENFEHLSRTERVTTHVKKICFHQEGEACLVATRDSLKVWSWEPDDNKAESADRIGTCLDSVDVRWSNVADMALVPGREELVSVSTINGVVQTYKVCLLEVATDKMQMKEVERRRTDNRARNKKPRRTFAPSSDRSRPRARWNSGTSPLTFNNSRTATPPPEPKPAEIPSPARSQGEIEKESLTESLILQAHQLRLKKKEERRRAEAQIQSETRNELRRDANSESSPQTNGVCDIESVGRSSISSKKCPLEAIEVSSESKAGAVASAGGPMVKPIFDRDSRSPSPPTQSKSPPAQGRRTIPAKISTPVGIDLADVVQRGFHRYSVEELVKVAENAKQKHEDMKSLLSSRLRQTQVLQSYWCKDRLGAAFQMLSEARSPAVDFLHATISQVRSQIPPLKVLVHLLPTLESLIGSEFEFRVRLGMDYLSLILEGYEMVIKGTLKSEPSSIGTNLIMEERLSRCQEILKMIERVEPVVKTYAEDYGGNAKRCFELCESIKS